MWGPVSFHSKVEKVKKVVRLDKHSRVQTYLNTHRRKVVPSWNLLDMKLVDRTSVSAVLWQLKQQWVSGWTDMWTKLPRSHGRCFSSSWRKGIKKKRKPQTMSGVGHRQAQNYLHFYSRWGQFLLYQTVRSAPGPAPTAVTLQLSKLITE